MKNPVSRSTLFLTELIIDLFVFVVCCVVCVGLLARARAMSLESARLTEAVYLAQSCAESLRATGEAPPAAGAAAGYEVLVERDDDASGLCSATITVTFEGETAYRLECAYPGEVAQ